MIRITCIASVSTSQRTQSLSITKTNQLMQYEEIISVCEIRRNAQIHCVGKTQGLMTLHQVIDIDYLPVGFKI
jgi:pyruvate-formate lyase-activating enzyme